MRTELTIEPVLEPSARPEFNALVLLTGEETVQGQAQEIVAQRTEESLGVEQPRETGPSDLLLQLVQAEAVGVEEHRCGASRDVVA